MNELSTQAICDSIEQLITYARDHLELDMRDSDWMRNRLLELFEQSPMQEKRALGDWIDDDEIMGVLSAAPSVIQNKFAGIVRVQDGMTSMRWLYNYGVANGYIKRAQLQRNLRYERRGLVITINTAKPEFKTMQAAARANSVDGSFAQCTICHANEGLASRSKRTLRTVPVTLGGQQWFWQFSPYGYFQEHGICVNNEHTPMHVDEGTFVRLIDFVQQFPNYFIGCNAALARIGGSVLAHDHYQGGAEVLPMQAAPARAQYRMPQFDDVIIEIVEWPTTAIRVVSECAEHVVRVSEMIRQAWSEFEDESLDIVPVLDGELQSSIAPTVRITERGYEMNIILRNNAVSEQYPDGIFHAHPEWFFIKREPIGLIEAQGLFILPGRLEEQLDGVVDVVMRMGISEFPQEESGARELIDSLPESLREFSGFIRVVREQAVEQLRQADCSCHVNSIQGHNQETTLDARWNNNADWHGGTHHDTRCNDDDRNIVRYTVSKIVLDEVAHICETILTNVAVFKNPAQTEQFVELLGCVPLGE